jgi:ribosome-associated protein
MATEAGPRAALICESLDEIKAQNIVLIDLRSQTIIADYFVICTGTSTAHLHGIAGNVLDKLRAQGIRTRAEGEASSSWIVLDYGDVVVHIQTEESREFYDLERLWAECAISQWPSSAPTS